MAREGRGGDGCLSCGGELATQEVAAADEGQSPGLDWADAGGSGQAQRLAQLVQGVGVTADVGQRHPLDGVGSGPFDRVVGGERDRCV